MVAGLGLLDCDHPGLASPGLFLLAGQSVMPAAKAVGPNAVGNAKAEHEVPGKRSLTCCAMERFCHEEARSYGNRFEASGSNQHSAAGHGSDQANKEMQASRTWGRSMFEVLAGTGQ